MITTEEDLQEALARLTLDRGDSLNLEAKTFSEYSDSSLCPSLCALANLPGGGAILLGVDERQDNPLVGVHDPHEIAQRVTSQARKAFSPPLTVDVRTLTMGDKTVVVVNVSETPQSAKPVKWQGKAYIRQYDGDYTMSLQEQQQMLRRHERPRDDRVAVPGTSRSDLDEKAVSEFITSVRQYTPALLNQDDETILRMLNVVTEDGEVTVAGLYALGIYPQQYLPHLSLTAAIEPDVDTSREVRAINRTDLTGRISQILNGAVEWVAQNIGRNQAVTADGNGVTKYEIPLVAVREVIANALVHRDLSDATAGRVVELRLTAKGMVLTSPGGLWGLSVDQLGMRDGKSAVNEFLYAICRHVGGPDHRVIEAMGTGIGVVREELIKGGLEAPQFIDNGVRFTVIFPNHALHSSRDLAWLGSLGSHDLTSSQKEALLRMRRGDELTNSGYRLFSGVDALTARSELKNLVEKGLVTQIGQKRGTRYVLAVR
ncbi:RNA-binding domain-containing protein [Schaalia vaccimaxillae]|uniref:RNA-binding domain-containing protein n=1 Tax=Schaalia vaccimaxillae TaxID=183916 RepID=UPI0003B75366|nr:RNA-binding domain-containing protein [Schaalia vaccimaxillae]